MISKQLLFNILKFLIFLSLGAGILYLVYRNQNAAFQEDCKLKGVPAADCSLIGEVINAFGSVNAFWIFMVLLAYTLSNVSRAARWSMLIRTLGYRPKFSNAFLTTILGYFANLGLPRMGELVRAGTMARYERIAVEKVIGTVAVDRVVDVLSIFVVTGLAFLLDYNSIIRFVNEYVNVGDKASSKNNLLLILLIAGVVTLVVFYIFRKSLLKSTFVQKIINIAKGFGQGLQTIAKVERPWLFILHSINVWLMYYLMCYFCFMAFAPTAGLSPIAALTVYVFGAWGMVVPSPGGMGTYHFLAQLALSFHGVSGTNGFAWANISFFTVNLGANIISGIIALILLPILNKDYEPMVEETGDEVKG